MSVRFATNLEVAREGYDRFNRGDIKWVVDQLDPEITWEDAPEMPDARVYRGLDEVTRFLESFARHWEEIRFEPEELRESGGVVIAHCRLVGRGRASGAQVDAPVTHVWEFRELRPLRVRTFFDRSEAAAAADAEASAG